MGDHFEQVTRFAAPLAFNFLHVIRMHDEVESRDGEPAQVHIPAALVPLLNIA